jgi:NADH-quinone oxidoreductase subunit J
MMPSKQLVLAHDGFGDIKNLGMELFEKWLLPFELISILLLVALIGAVVYGRKEEV